MKNYQGYGLPERLTLAYQRIPPRVRRIWSMGSSSSELALTAIRDGHRGARHWAAFFQHTRGVRFLPGYTVGAGIRRAGLAMLVLDSGTETHGWGKVPYPPLPHSGMAHWLDGANPKPRRRGSLGAFWGLPLIGMENKELPDWFPTTGAGTYWFDPMPPGLFSFLTGIASGLAGPQVWERRSYPANPPPSLNWNGPKKK